MALSRRRKEDTRAAVEALAKASAFVFDFPSVLEFLYRSAWEDASPRTPGTVMILLDESRWKLWAHDRDSSESLFVSAQSLEEAFTHLESCLADGTGEWRRDRGVNGTPGRKRP